MEKEEFSDTLSNHSEDSPDASDASDLEYEQEKEFIKDKTRASNRKNKRSGGFQSMGLSPPLLNAILKKGYKVPTPIQRKSIPDLLAGLDIVAMARTGSGKSAAFLVPMLEKLKAHSTKVGARALILSPSRELAMQTMIFAKQLGKYTDLRCATIVGGDQMEEQFEMMSYNPDIIVATPGRLLHVVMEMNLDLKSVEYLVFDEADRLFELGFADTLREIMHKLSPNRQTCLFSATLPKSLVEFAKAGLQMPKLIRLDVDNKISPDLQLAFFPVRQCDKDGALLYLIRNIIDPSHQTIIFVSTKHHVEYLHELLMAFNVENSFIYGQLDQTARKMNLAKFRNGKTKFLIVTDVASRGIDIPFLNNVIHYDFTDKSKLFVHRSGRAARAGRTGTAYALLTNDDLPYLIDLQLFLNRPFKYASEKDSIEEKDLVLGDFPQDLYLFDQEEVNSLLKENATVESLHRVSENGYKLYLKTRTQPSKESFVRAKEIIETAPKGSTLLGIHPVLQKKAEENNLATCDIMDKIRSFRPQETIFEIKKMGLKLGAGNEVMKTRRSIVDGVIEKSRDSKKNRTAANEQKAKSQPRKREAECDDETLEQTFGIFKKPKRQINEFGVKLEQTGAFRDSDFYVQSTPADMTAERQYAVTSEQSSFMKEAAAVQFDVNADDVDMMKKNHYMAVKFDKKKGRYVRQTVGKDNKKMLRTDSGGLLPASYKTDVYEKWKKKNKHLAMGTGDDADRNDEVSNRLRLSNGGHHRKFRHTQTKESKPLDKLSTNYERKLRQQQQKMKKALSGEHPAINKVKANHQLQKSKSVRNELKSFDKIQKERKVKEKRREKNARPSKKKNGGKKGGGGGGGYKGGNGNGKKKSFKGRK